MSRRHALPSAAVKSRSGGDFPVAHDLKNATPSLSRTTYLERSFGGRPFRCESLRRSPSKSAAVVSANSFGRAPESSRPRKKAAASGDAEAIRPLCWAGVRNTAVSEASSARASTRQAAGLPICPRPSARFRPAVTARTNRLTVLGNRSGRSRSRQSKKSSFVVPSSCSAARGSLYRLSARRPLRRPMDNLRRRSGLIDSESSWGPVGARNSEWVRNPLCDVSRPHGNLRNRGGTSIALVRIGND